MLISRYFFSAGVDRKNTSRVAYEKGFQFVARWDFRPQKTSPRVLRSKSLRTTFMSTWSLPCSRNNRIDWCVYKNINLSAAEGQILALSCPVVCMKGRFTAKVIRASPSSLSHTRRKLSRKTSRTRVTFPRHMLLNFDKLNVLRCSWGKSELKCTRQQWISLKMTGYILNVKLLQCG